MGAETRNGRGANTLPSALMCPYEWEDPAFRRSGRLPNLRYGDQLRAIWVSRYEFNSDKDISDIMQRSAQAGFNTVFFQVRGNGTVYYPSNLEPWSETYGWKSPGFDPLKHAIGEAHSQNMALHAWVNVMPMWRGSHPPTNELHMYCSHPEWSWYDRYGNRQPLNSGFYVSINPCLPQARKHLVEVCREIVSQYEIDGLHLDYIRFPNEKPVVNGEEYPCDKKTLELFNQDTGSSPEKSPKLWDQWRCNSVTSLLRDIRRTVKSLRPQIVLTAAVGAERKQALSKFQDVEQWRKDRLLDAVVPMNYTDCQRTFRFRVEHEWKQDDMTTVGGSFFPRKHLREKINRRKLLQSESLKLTSENDLMEWSRPPEPAVIMGTSVEFGDSQLHQKQISLALQRFGHFSVFCFSNLFNTGSSQTPAKLLPFLKVLADASQFVSKSRGILHRHPFQSRDIQSHPEESFPYDQLHFYDHVPPELMFEPLKARNINMHAQGGFRERTFTVFTNRDAVKSRRTHRRNLQAKLQREGHNLDEVLKRSRVLVKAVSRQAALKNKENKEIHLPRMNWEVVKMSEATAWEESKLCPSKNEGTKTDMHMSRVQLSSKRWVEMSMAHAKLKLVSDNLRVSRGQFNFKNGKPFGCISCAWQCPFSNISVNLVAGLGGLAKMMKCCIMKWMES